MLACLLACPLLVCVCVFGVQIGWVGVVPRATRICATLEPRLRWLSPRAVLPAARAGWAHVAVWRCLSPVLHVFGLSVTPCAAGWHLPRYVLRPHIDAPCTRTGPEFRVLAGH